MSNEYKVQQRWKHRQKYLKFFCIATLLCFSHFKARGKRQFWKSRVVPTVDEKLSENWKYWKKCAMRVVSVVYGETPLKYQHRKFSILFEQHFAEVCIMKTRCKKYRNVTVVSHVVRWTNDIESRDRDRRNQLLIRHIGRSIDGRRRFPLSMGIV